MMRTSISLLTATILCLAVGCSSSEKAPAPEQGNDTSGSSQSATNVPVADSTSASENPANSSTTSDSSGLTRFSLKFFAWNVESEGADPKVIANQLASEFGRYDLFALTEVLPESAQDFASAVGDQYRFVLSETGNNDRMMLIYNSNTLNLVRSFEIHDINYRNRYRSPLVGHFRDALTGKEMLIMVNHLARGSEKTRQIQAKDLVQWARNQNLPIVALGDYNFDYVFESRKGNEAFRLFMQDNIWRWIEPIELIDTNWYDNPQEPDGKDDYPGSMLDFAFVAGGAKDWTTSCKIIVRDGDFPDDKSTSDHRPYELIVSGL